MNYRELQNIDFNKIKRVDLGTNLNFSEAENYISVIKEGLLFFEQKENLITGIDIESIRQITTSLINLCNQILTFEQPSGETRDNTIARRDQLINEIKKLKKKFNQELLPIITDIKLNTDNKHEKLLSDTQQKITAIESAFNSKIYNFDTNANQKIKDAENKLNKAGEILKDVNKIKEEAQNFSIEKLVEKYGDIFKKQAVEYKDRAKLSLGIFSVLLATLFALVYFLFAPLIEKISTISDTNFLLEYTVVTVLFRLSLLGIAFIAVKESLKNFNINMHLYSLNIHRQNSLQSFQTLISNTSMSETRDLIIKEISNTIYSNQEDGYLSSSDKKAISIAQVTELIKALK